MPPSDRVIQVGVTIRLGQSRLHHLQIRSTKVTSPSNLPSFFLALALVVPFFPWPFFLPFLHCMHFKFIDVSPFAFDPTDLAVHLSIFLAGWVKGVILSHFFYVALFYQSTPSCLKVMGWWGGVGGPCDFSVSPSPFGLDFGTLDFGTSDSGLTIRILSLLTTHSAKNLIFVPLLIW